MLLGKHTVFRLNRCFRLGLVIYNPIELLKIKAQSNRTSHINYKSAISDILRKDGPKGLYIGFWSLFYRDVPAWGVYFWAYELLKERTGINKS